MRVWSKRCTCAVGLLAVLWLSGCKSKYIHATLENKSGEALALVQVEYPSAAFGMESLKPAQPFHYSFKLLGSGPVKVTWVDAAKQPHTQEGPRLLEGEQGSLDITFLPDNKIDFHTDVRP